MDLLEKSVGNQIVLHNGDIADCIVSGIRLRKCKCTGDEPVSRVNGSYYKAGAGHGA